MDSSAKTGKSLFIPSLDHHRRLELLAASLSRAIRAGASAEKIIGVASPHFFQQGERCSWRE